MFKSPFIFLLVLLFVITSTTAAPLKHKRRMLHFSEDAAADDETTRDTADLTREEIKLPRIRVTQTLEPQRKKKGGTQDSFFGIPDYFQSGHNITRLSHMLYRVIEQYKIRSMVDIPCRSHSRWMGKLLEHIKGKDGESFVYYCVDSSPKILELAESRMPTLSHVSANYILRKFWKLPMPRADLVFAWEGLEKMKTANVNTMLEQIIRDGRQKYLLVGSSPSVKKNSNGYILNIRRAPFSYGLPKRIFKELGDELDLKHPEKQMYLYATAEMVKRSK